MNSLPADALRQAYLDYFVRHGHTVVHSGSLIPSGDASLLFTNAGMVPFKNVFVGAESRPYSRATSSQKCMRVSGKHNDLEAVGRTTRHHTFFEMLGNFSFGDYFKEEAIVLAWRFLTDTLQLPTERLWITVFGGAPGLPADTEAGQLWRKVSGLPADRILAKGVEDNFWSMGDTGPCGPCTEIHYDQGQGPVRPEDFDNGRVMEIWNNVFMQFNRQAAGLQNLPAPSVDTGMGLERVAAVVQGADSNYHSDVFAPLLDAVAAQVGRPYGRSPGEDDVSMRVIVDHARACSFLVADGIQPSNEGRGYVLRRIMRRAIRHGRRLGLSDLFLHQICAATVARMGAAYPELVEAQARIDKVAQVEEASFRRTLEGGLLHLESAIDAARTQGHRRLDGSVVFRLYDTFGFPKDLTEVIAAEKGLTVDQEGFDRDMQAQQARSRGADAGAAAPAPAYAQLARDVGGNSFIGDAHEDAPLAERSGVWRQRQVDGVDLLEAQVQLVGLVVDGQVQAQVQAPAQVEVLLAETPLYAEGGGQVGDIGLLSGADDAPHGPICNTTRPLEGMNLSQVDLQHGQLKVGDRVWAGYDRARRRQIRAHHSGTHLLHAALRASLGGHVAQAGSRVDAQSLRFDFSHFAALSQDELRAIEAAVQVQIAANAPVQLASLSFTEAKAQGAIALFGEKYGDTVRVISMGQSVELCGGSHARSTGELGTLLILREEAVQSGVRRIEARAGAALQAALRGLAEQLQRAQASLQGSASPQADDDPSLQQLQRALGQRQALGAALSAQGEAASPLPAPVGIPPPRAQGPFDLAQAQACRDTWHGLVQLLAARPGDLAGLAAHLEALTHSALLAQVAALLAANRQDERRLEAAKRSDLVQEAASIVAGAETIAGLRLVRHALDSGDSASLRHLADDLRGRLGSGVVCLGLRGPKAALLVAVSPDLNPQVHAGNLVKALAPCIAGRGGGGAAMAQAGGSDGSGLEAAFDRLAELLSQRVH